MVRKISIKFLSAEFAQGVLKVTTVKETTLFQIVLPSAEKGSIPKERICSPWEQITSFQSRPILEGSWFAGE